ncbi:MAG TPA: response regulator [Anaerolineales bacterium]|nr:response regulator [Anaerolineales bacterium]HMX19891.1 response regulator [Anaerolineales bacterium]HMX76470.1 response regulator [Anaerolineales bacterium]HMZ43616.1 response regulator [Anaerolineales bacterium]HNA54964.1 response regulator [Anaerolineales bacterium]
MDRNILLVDDQRDILRLLRSTLETLKKTEIKIFEAPSGEEALIESSRHKVDLLVTDYKLPGMSGLELMHKVRVRHPEAKVILITGLTDRKVREEMLNAGALAVFDKPIPLADFLDVVERGLGFVQTIFPPERPSDEKTERRHARVSDLLANFRQDINAEAVFLLNERGLVQARTGKLRDESMEVSLFSTLMAIHNASLKVAKYNHQEKLDSYHVFSSGDNDLLFIPVAPMYALLVAGNGLVREDRILESVNALLALRKEVERSLRSLGVTGELQSISPKTVPLATAAAPTIPIPASIKPMEKPAEAAPSPELEALLKNAAATKDQTANMDDFWNQAAEKHGNKPASKEVISLEDARKLGLLPGDGK